MSAGFANPAGARAAWLGSVFCTTCKKPLAALDQFLHSFRTIFLLRAIGMELFGIGKEIWFMAVLIKQKQTEFVKKQAA